MKILIVKVSALGDVVHALPVLAYIRAAEPAAEVDWLVEEGFAPLLQGHPLLRAVLPLQTRRWRKLPPLALVREFFAFVRRLRAERYDLVLDLQGNSKSGLVTLLARATAKYGYDRRAVREWPNLLATRQRVSLGAADYHVGQRALALVRAALPAAVQVACAGPLPVADQARREVADQLRQLGLPAGRHLIVCHYGTTWRTKLWALEYWQTLVAQLAARPDAVLLLTWGNAEEQQAAAAIAAQAPGALLWPRGSLPQLVALLAVADLVVGGDTGPVHIAAAVGTPTVSLYRVTDARRNGPLGREHRCLQVPLACAACLRKDCPQQQVCASAIAPATVLAAIDELLPETGQPPKEKSL
ncbi:lipopolysaccharide heptosyltransferase I [Desulfuromonas thiophila]|uniref:lipopolysaccharide heptosyltransferase I n=1 Tax=Desulfuromonas thiophila TaxID=57664 RepID=UPI0024A86821|nr:lipopolysaccharide heptosyltransferase I [Desulfuromonas thiophila]